MGLKNIFEPSKVSKNALQKTAQTILIKLVQKKASISYDIVYNTFPVIVPFTFCYITNLWM